MARHVERAGGPGVLQSLVHETPEELLRMQELLDTSMAEAGAHLKAVITNERRLDAVELCRRLQDMRLLRWRRRAPTAAHSPVPPTGT